MKEITPTKQQLDAVEAAKINNKLKITSLSGSAKTTSLCLIANELKEKSLYLAFNKNMAEEAKSKFPSWVEVRTTHSLAYRAFGVGIAHKLSRPNGAYKNVCGTGTEISRHFKIKSQEFNGRDITPSGIGLAVKETVANFEYSGDFELEDKHVSFSVLGKIDKKDNQVIRDMQKWKATVFPLAKKLWEMRQDSKSPILATHDTYLKMYQLSKPDLSEYKNIYIDEFQDSNQCILKIMETQKSKIIMVGDEYQSIYAFRGSINALSLVDCPEKSLSKSFRFGDAIANVANAILSDKGKAMTLEGCDIQSKVGERGSVVDYKKPYTVIFRTNAHLIGEAVEMIKDGESVKIEADMRSFTNLLSSVLALSDKRDKDVRHELVKSFVSFNDFCTEAELTGGENFMVANMVKQNKAKYILAFLSSYKPPINPHIILTTAHKAKGLEYDQVVLAEDFPSIYDNRGTYVGLDTQERNLLYVAATRPRIALEYNSTVFDMLARGGSRSACNSLTGALHKESKEVWGIINAE